MDFEFVVILLGAGLIVAIIAIFCALYVWDSKKANTPVTPQKSVDERLNDEGEVVCLHCEVADMICGVSIVGHQGYKQPKAEKQFIIKFKNDSGDIFDVAVSEEMYDGFDKGLVGTLTLIDGNISSFEPDIEAEIFEG